MGDYTMPFTPVAFVDESDDFDGAMMLMTLRMMLMEMLALPVQMRCLLNTLTLCHS